MNKILELIFRDRDTNESCGVYEYEYPNIVVDHKIDIDECVKALDTITAFLIQNGHYRLVVDLEKRNRLLSPPKEMTIKEIEDILGHRVKIVDNKSLESEN